MYLDGNRFARIDPLQKYCFFADVIVTVLIFQDLQQKWEEVLELIPKRDTLLDDETTRQQNNERLRVQFAQMANQVGSWCKQRIARLTDIGMNAQGTLENQLNELKTLNEEIDGFKSHVLQLDDLNKVGIGCYVFRLPGKVEFFSQQFT